MIPPYWLEGFNRLKGCRVRFNLAHVSAYEDVVYSDGSCTIITPINGPSFEIATPYDDFCAVMDEYNAPPSDALRPQANPLPKATL